MDASAVNPSLVFFLLPCLLLFLLLLGHVSYDLDFKE